jgi:hypothetical protein
VRRRVQDYIDELRKVAVEFVDKQTVGMAVTWPTVVLWPYDAGYEDPERLLHTLTHEVIHHVHPELPEGAVDALAWGLLRRPTWRGAAVDRLFREYHREMRTIDRRARRSRRR